MYLRELHAGRLREIDHCYLVPGHSYMTCDRAFGNIENYIRAPGDIYDFKGYCSAIAASVTERQEVVVMRRDDFLDFEVLQKVTVHRPSQPTLQFLGAIRFAFRLAFRESYQLAMDYDGPLGSSTAEGYCQLSPLTLQPQSSQPFWQVSRSTSS